MKILYSGSVWVKQIENKIQYCLLYFFRSLDAKYLNIIRNVQYRRKGFCNTAIYPAWIFTGDMQSPEGKIYPWCRMNPLRAMEWTYTR